jgi:cysteine desulfurase
MTRHTPMENGLANTLGVSSSGVLGQDVLSLFPGPAASTGPACHAGDENPAESLLMMGVTHGAARGAVALSLGHGSPEVGITAAADELAVALRATLGQ